MMMAMKASALIIELYGIWSSSGRRNPLKIKKIKILTNKQESEKYFKSASYVKKIRTSFFVVVIFVNKSRGEKIFHKFLFKSL
jgi:hypothetical protein